MPHTHVPLAISEIGRTLYLGLCLWVSKENFVSHYISAFGYISLHEHASTFLLIYSEFIVNIEKQMYAKFYVATKQYTVQS